MVKLFLLLVLFGPNTEVLVISESCAPCVKALKIVENLQAEGYDVIIIDRKNKRFRVRQTPTLIVREYNKRPKKIVGLKTEEEYRELISQWPLF